MKRRGGPRLTNPAIHSKLLPFEDLEKHLAERRSRGERIVMTNGCFDLLHPGHLSSLEFARRQGDCLIVAINSDRSTTVLKGAGHPIVDECGRAKLLAGLICVDYVVVFDDVSVASTVERLHPDVLVKSGEYALDQVVGHEIVQQYGGQVLLAPMQPGYSTTAIIDRIRGCTDPGNTTRGR